MKWTKEAELELKKVPVFVRKMAKRAVEMEVGNAGRDVVTAEDLKIAREKHISFAEEQPEKDGLKPTRIAIVRCETVSEVCPGVACFKAFKQRRAYFMDYGLETEIIGFFTCGGCPGRRVSRLVEKLKPFNLDVLHLSSCMMLENSYPACPHKEEIKKTVEAMGVKVVSGTHH